MQKTTKRLKAHISLRICFIIKKEYLFWLKTYILFPNLAPALTNEHYDGDLPKGE